MTIQISAFRWVPPFAQGYVRDLRVRWALEEAGLAYEATLIGREDQNSAQYREWQPFGQVPAYKDDKVELFESGAIVLYIANTSEALAPKDDAGRARVTMWVIAALNSIEPNVMQLASVDIFHKGEAWTRERRPQVVEMIEKRLAALAENLGDRQYLEERFTAADIIMTTVLRELVQSGILGKFPALDAYHARCMARPAFGRAMESQLAAFKANEPAAA